MLDELRNDAGNSHTHAIRIPPLLLSMFSLLQPFLLRQSFRAIYSVGRRLPATSRPLFSYSPLHSTINVRNVSTLITGPFTYSIHLFPSTFIFFQLSCLFLFSPPFFSSPHYFLFFILKVLIRQYSKERGNEDDGANQSPPDNSDASSQDSSEAATPSRLSPSAALVVPGTA